MQVPCPACGTITAFKTPESEASSTLVHCQGCSGQFRVAIQRPESKGDIAAYRRAREFALENAIDVVTAHSVLEGLITLAEARDEGEGMALGPGFEGQASPTSSAGAGKRPVPPEPVRASDHRSKGVEVTQQYDPGFASAVRDGCLTIRQAVERGSHAALATHLSTRHRLPMDLAYMAAENRITIRQAVMQNISREAERSPARRSVFPRGRAMVYASVGLLLVLAGICIGAVWREAPERPELASVPTSTPSAPTAPKTDASGRIVEIVGGDPKSVLVSYCTSGSDASLLEPLDIVETVPPMPAWRLGLFRMMKQPGAPLRAIRIRKDPATSRWMAGDGQKPIPTEEMRAEAVTDGKALQPGRPKAPDFLSASAPTSD